MHRGYIKLWRKIRENELMLHEGICQLFLFIAVSVRSKPGVEFGVHLEAGQMISGRFLLSSLLRCKPSTIQKRLKWMKDRRIIDVKSINKGSVITLLNWDTYNSSVSPDYHESISKVSGEYQQSITLEECKNEKNEKNINTKEKIYKKENVETVSLFEEVENADAVKIKSDKSSGDSDTAGKTPERREKRSSSVRGSKNRSVLFRDCEYREFEDFRAALPDWTEEKCEHYFESAKEYSEAKGAKYVNWISAVKHWDRMHPWQEPEAEKENW